VAVKLKYTGLENAPGSSSVNSLIIVPKLVHPYLANGFSCPPATPN
jgi:hypothetical protein